MLVISGLNSLGFGSFIWWKVYTLLTLRLGMKNQLGSLKYRHNEDGQGFEYDIMLGSIAIFANLEYLLLIIGGTIFSIGLNYLFDT